MNQDAYRDGRDVCSRWRNPSWWHFLIVSPWVLLAAYTLHQAHLFRNVATRQVTTWGTITGHEPSHHSRYSFTFRVGDRTYRGSQIPQGQDLWRSGQRVIVFYDPADPAKNALTDFAIQSRRAIGPLPLLVASIALVWACIFLLRRNASLAREHKACSRRNADRSDHQTKLSSTLD